MAQSSSQHKGSAAITRYFTPDCPSCGAARSLMECDEALRPDGEPVTASGRIMEVAIGTYDALKRHDGAFDALYVGGHNTPTAVGITAIVDFANENGMPLDIQRVVYRCAKCGAEWSSPYDLAAALARAGANVWNKDGKRK